MRHFIGGIAVTGVLAVLLTGISPTPAHADDDHRYIPHQHHPLRFTNPDGSPHLISDTLTRSRRNRAGTRRGRTRSERTERSEPRDEDRDRDEPRSIRGSSPSTRSATEPRVGERDQPEPRAEKATLICPVTGDRIASVKDAIGQSTYKGKTYYFCCEGCKPRFDKDPAKFVRNAAAGKFEKM